MQGSGQAEVEAGVIDEEDGVGFFPGDALEGLVEFLTKVAVAAKDIPEADDGGIVRPVFDGGGEGVEFGSAEAGDSQVGAVRLEVGEQGGGVGVAAGFAGEDEEVHGRGKF